MKVKSILAVNLLIVVLMAGVALWAAGKAPPGMELPTHWNMEGEVDRTAPALTALLIPVGVTLFLGLVFAIIPAIEPLQDRMAGSAPLLRATWLGTVALMIALQGIIAAPIFGFDVGAGAVIVLVGLLFVLLGNMLPKSRPGFFVGIRTPWTITDADNWIATHRLGGKLFMLAGLAMILAGIIPMPGPARLAVVLASVLIAAGLPILYSWRFWQRGNRRDREA